MVWHFCLVLSKICYVHTSTRAIALQILAEWQFAINGGVAHLAILLCVVQHKIAMVDKA